MALNTNRFFLFSKDLKKESIMSRKSLFKIQCFTRTISIHWLSQEEILVFACIRENQQSDQQTIVESKKGSSYQRDLH